MTHRGSLLAWLEGCMAAVGFGDTEIGWDICVGAGFRGGENHAAGACANVALLFDAGLSVSVPHLLVSHHAQPLSLSVLGWRFSSLDALVRLGQLLLPRHHLLVEFDGRGLIHGQLGHARHRLARHGLDAGLQLVDALGQVHRFTSALGRLAPQSLRQRPHLLQYQLLLQQLLLLVVQSLLQLRNLVRQLLVIEVLPLQRPPPALVGRRLQVQRQHVAPLSLAVELLFQLGHLARVLGDLGLQLGHHPAVPFEATFFEVEHAYLRLPFVELDLARVQDLLLDVALLVQNAELVVAVDELNARIVALLHHNLVLLLEPHHLLLQRVDDRVELIDLRNLLIN
mmetsp:Transcript_11168/g.23726  ORF Transcript_11168/g.23726 Transcript_11168/m.23726 type:complete len:340 (+) Transcript_11168:68-1087(+)